MLPQSVRLQHDEMLSSWLDVITDINVFDDRFIFRLLTGRAGRVMAHGKAYPSELEKLCDGIRRNGRTDVGIPELVRDNTLFFIELPFLKAGEQAQTLELILRGCGVRTLTRRLSHCVKAQKICPVCAEEDRNRCGRAYIHVPHQVPGVEACYRHGCRLVPEDTYFPGQDPEKADKTETKIARFYYDLYVNPVCIDDRIRSFTVKKAMEDKGMTFRSFSDSYGETIRINTAKVWHGLKVESKHRFLAAVFGYDAESFRETAAEFTDIDEEADILSEISESYDLLSPYGPVMRLGCKTCGTEFYTHPEMIRLGAGCPVCDSALPEEAVIDRYVQRHGDGEYDVTAEGARTRIIHRPCGKEVRASLYSFIFQNGDCPVCAGRDRIGKGRKNNDGQRMTIVDYDGCLNMKVRFDDGTVVEHRTYQQFLRGAIENPNNNLKTRREGLKGVSVTGRRMTVIKYRKSTDVDIRFEDGAVVKGQKFENFLSGKVRHPSEPAGNGVPVIKGTGIYDLSVRVGEKGVANGGQEMEIVRYRNARDADVRFEDGTEVCGITYSHFKQGRVGKPSRPGRRAQRKSSPEPVSLRHKREREGKKREDRYGQKMEIIRYRNARDADVRFDDGTVVRHKRYGDFLRNGIKNPAREQRLLEEKWLGQAKTARNGMRMEVIACRKYDDADIRFEDGTVVEHVSLKHFQDGSIRHPGIKNPRLKDERVGKTSRAKNGQMMTIIAYRGARDIDIRFEDGTVVKNKSYDKFSKGTIRHPNLPHSRREPARLTDHKGEIGTASDGSLIKISAFREYDDIDVMFEDGTVSKHRQYI